MVTRATRSAPGDAIAIARGAVWAAVVIAALLAFAKAGDARAAQAAGVDAPSAIDRAAPAPRGAAPASAASTRSADDAAESTLSDAELDRALAPLTDPSVDVRRAAAKAVTSLGLGATRAIEARLAALRAEDFDLPPLLKAASHDARARGDAFDLLEALVDMPPNGPAYRLAIETTALAHALAHVGTVRATRDLVQIAADHDGAFRGEVTRQTKQLGERALPALIVARRGETPALRRWANATLEDMKRARPPEQVQTKSNEVLAEVLRAFGAVREVDALNVVVSFVSSDRVQVRAAAREALQAYGDDALPKLREAYANLTGHPAADDWSAAETAKQLFTAYDRIRLQDVYALVDDGLAKQRQGKLDEAIAAFDKALARQPLLDRRAEMAPAYAQRAQALEASDRDAALAAYRKALRLDPTGDAAPRIESAIATLEGEELVARGVADADLFRRALKLDPTNARARAALDRLETDEQARSQRLRRWAIAAALFVAAIVGIVLFGGKVPLRRRAADPRPDPRVDPGSGSP